jgi:KDO2-lipid IV(A) lauroyltransferase
LPVELFGAKTKIPAGPALLATETGAPAYVSGVRRVGPGRYRGVLWPVPTPGGLSRRERSRSMAREEALLFERVIADAPEQWLAVFHPIWPDLPQGQETNTGEAR